MIEQPSTLRLDSAQLASGIRLHYAEAGDPAAPPVLMLHGLSDSWFSYSRVLPALAARYHVYALDQRGHGDSDRPAGGYSMAGMAADAVAFMDAQGLTRATVVGHSMGSVVATELALAAPERLAALVLVGPNTGWNSPDVAGLQQEVEALPDPVPAAFAREFQISTAFEPLPEAFLERVVAESLKLPARVWRAALAGLLASDYVGRLGEITVPALVLGGEEDLYCTAANQREVAARLGNAELKLYTRLGHCPHWERPEAFVEDLEAFLGRVLGA
ncbi:MAG TPA: alpha/beta hydrolase [Chloroflexaceae bacterium]|nr:alpha/beta hydrolase [Chloroflexaceae bacterium]